MITDMHLVRNWRDGDTVQAEIISASAQSRPTRRINDRVMMLIARQAEEFARRYR